MNYCTRVHPLNSLDLALLVGNSPKSLKGMQNWPHGILVRVSLTLDTGQILDGGWIHNTQQQCASWNETEASKYNQRSTTQHGDLQYMNRVHIRYNLIYSRNEHNALVLRCIQA